MKREDCINYYTYPDMGAQIPCCKKNVGLGNCPCESCSQYTNHIEPCEDAISRQIISDYVQSHIQEINTGYGDLNKHTNEILRMIVDYIEKMESITPKPKTGYWEWVQYDSNPNIGNWHCSECRTIIPYMPEETDNTPIYKWCPMCGAKMESEDKE